jgi:hypothetical protein
MVVSRLPAGCRADASASRPLDSASTVTTAYQCPAASCLLVHFFPFASVCWLVITSPLVALPPSCIAFCRTCLSHPSSTPLLRPRWLVVVSHLVTPHPPLDVPPAHVLPIAAPLPYIHQLALSCTAIFARTPTRPPARRLTCCLLRHLRLKSTSSPSRTAIFIAPSLGAAAIAGVLKCMAHSPSGGIANGHCSLSYGSHPTTHPPAPPHRHLYSSTIHHPCPTLIISWRKVMTWRLFIFV